MTNGSAQKAVMAGEKRAEEDVRYHGPFTRWGNNTASQAGLDYPKFIRSTAPQRERVYAHSAAFLAGKRDGAAPSGTEVAA